MSLKVNTSHVSALQKLINNNDFTFVQQDNGRVVVKSAKTGAVLGVNLQQAKYAGPAGPVFTVHNNVGEGELPILPHLTQNMNVNAKQGQEQFNFRARTSLGATADLISFAHADYQERLRGGDTKATWEGSFQKLLRTGSEEYGISPQPSLPYNATEDVKRRTYQQVMYSERVHGKDQSGKTVRPTPFAAQQAAMQANLAKRIGAGSTEFIPGAGPTVNSAGQPLDTGMTFRGMNLFETTLHDNYRLVPLAASPFGRRNMGDPHMTIRDPYKQVKALANPGAQNLVAPYKVDRSGAFPVYEQMTPGVITNTSSPNYAFPNVKSMAGEDNRAYEVRRGVVVDNAPVPGSMFAYQNERDIQADLWAQESTSRTNIGDMTVEKLASDEVQIDFGAGGRSIIGQRFGEGRSTAPRVGMMKVGDREEAIKMRVGAGGFVVQNVSMTIPKWVNEQGESVSNFVENRGISSTDKYVKKLQDKFGIRVNQVEGSNMSLDFGGLSFASTAPKGFGGKAGEIFTGIKASIQAAGRTLGVSRLTGEMKNAEFLRSSFMAAMNPGQLKQYFEDYATSTYGTKLGPAAAQLSQHYNRTYSNADESAPVGVDMEELANKMNEFSGGEFKGYGVQLAAEMYKANIAPHAVDSPENQRNLDIYEAGNVGGAEMPISTWSSDNIEILRNTWERNMRAENKKVTQDEITSSFAEHFKGVDNLTGAQKVFSERFGDTKSLTKLSMKLSKTAAYFGKFIMPRRMEYAHHATANQEFRSGLSRAFPEFAKSMGVNTDVINANTASTRSLLGGLRFAAWQTERMQNSESMGPASGVREISDLELTQMQGTIQSMQGKPKSEIMDALISNFGADDDESTVWRTKTGDTYMMNPRAVKAMNYTELGIDSSAVSGAFLSTIRKMNDVITDDGSNMANDHVRPEVRMNQAVKPLYEMMKKRITGSGKYLKKAFSQDLPSGSAGRTGFAPWLFSNEQDLGVANIRSTIRRMGFKGAEFGKAVGKAMREGFQIADTRFPMPNETAIMSYVQPGRADLESRIGTEAYRAQANPAERGNQTNVGLGWGVVNAGDYDRDPNASLTNMKNVQGLLEIGRSEELAGKELTNKQVFEIEKKMFHSQKFADKVNAVLGSTGDMYKNKDIIGGLIKQNLAASSYEDIFNAGLTRNASKTKQMGIGYNPRLALKPAMAAIGGYSDQEIANAESSGAIMYQPGLDQMIPIDKIEGIDNRAGVPVAAMISGGYFGKDSEGQATFHLGGGQFIKRQNQIGPNGEKLTPTMQEGRNFDLRKMLTNVNYARGVVQYAAMQIQKGVPGKDGEVLGEYSPMQAASLVAPHGKQEELRDILANTPRDQWATKMTSYLDSQLDPNLSEEEQAQQLASAPVVTAALTRAVDKAFNNENPDGTERIEGSGQAMEVLMTKAPDMYNALKASAVGFAYENRGKRNSLRSLAPSFVQHAARMMSGATNMGRKMKAYAQMIVGGKKMVNLDNVRYEQKQDEIITKQASAMAARADKIFASEAGLGEIDFDDPAALLKSLEGVGKNKPNADGVVEVSNPAMLNIKTNKDKIVPARDLETGNAAALARLEGRNAVLSDRFDSKGNLIHSEGNAYVPPEPEVPAAPDLIETAAMRSASVGKALAKGVSPVPETGPASMLEQGKAKRKSRTPSGGGKPPVGATTSGDGEDDGKIWRYSPTGKKQNYYLRKDLAGLGGGGSLSSRARNAAQTALGLNEGHPDDDPTAPKKQGQAAQIMGEVGNVPEAIGMKIKGAYERQMGYLSEGANMTEYVSGVLDEMGIGVFSGEANDDTPNPTRSMQERIQIATKTDYKGFIGRLQKDERKFKQLQTMTTERQDTNLALAVGNRAEGVTQEMMAHFRSVSRGEGNLGRDLVTNGLGDVSYAVKGNTYKDARAVMMAQSIENEPQFQEEYEKLKKSGLMDRTDIDAHKDIAAYAQKNPALAQYARTASALVGKETSPYVPEKMKQLAEFAGTVEKLDKANNLTAKEGALSVGAAASAGGVLNLKPEDAEKLRKSFDKLKDAMAEVGKVSDGNNEKEKERTRNELRRAEILSKGELANSLKGAAQQELQAMRGKIFDAKGKFTGSKEQLEDYGKLAKKASEYELEASTAEQEAEALKPETRGAKWGSAARRMLGGFGLMYAKTIVGMATEGLGYGQQERLAFDQAGAQASYAAIGGANLPVNQGNVLNTNTALNGINNDPRIAMQIAMSKNPYLREGVNAAKTGLSTWGYTQFASTQLFTEGSAGAKNLAALALPLAGLAVASNMMIDANSRSQDPRSLAYRTTTDRGGPNDYLALAQMSGGTILNSLTNGKLGGDSANNLNSYFGNKRFQVGFQQALDQGVSTADLLSGNYGDKWQGPSSTQVITKADRFFALQRSVAEKFANSSTEAQAQTTAYLARSGMSVEDKNVEGIMADYELGGIADKLSNTIIQGLGTNAKDRKKQQTALQAYLANKGDLTEDDKEIMASGAQFLGQVQGLKFLPGYSTDVAKQTELASKAGLLAGTRAGDAYLSSAATYSLAQQAGVTAYKAPDINNYLSNGAAISMTPAQVAQRQAQDQAFQAQSQNRLAGAQRWMTQAYGFGNYASGDAMRNAMMNVPIGSEWGANRVANLDPMMLAAASQAGSVNLSNMPGMTTFNGTQVNANYAAYTDRNLAGNVTGLAWGTTSFRLGDMSGAQMAGNIWGSGYQNNKQFDQGAIAAGVSGVALPAPIKMPDGSVVSSVGGQMGMQLYQQNLNYQQQLSGMNFQQRNMNLDTAFTYAGWKIDDAERAASYQHQMFQFNMQEQGINRSVANFTENRQMDRGQSLMQRGWTQNDWGFNAMQRDQSWGWKQEDFQEESRFMTGRQRRLAERQMKRDTIVHNQEGEQIEKQKERQQELWALEDKRFVIQKKQFDQSIEEQRLQLAEARRYYDQQRGFENARIALTRKHFEEELKLRKEQMAVTRQYTEQNHKLNLTMMQLEMSAKLTGGVLQTVTDNGFENLRESLLKSISPLLQFIQVLNGLAGVSASAANIGSAGSSTTIGGTASGGSASGGYVGPGHAAGGMLNSDVDRVGEKGWEFSIGGNIIPHEISKQLQYAGLRPGSSASEGKEKLMNLLSGKPNIPSAQFLPVQSPAASNMKESAQEAQPINIYIGNERIASFVLDTVSREMRI